MTDNCLSCPNCGHKCMAQSFSPIVRVEGGGLREASECPVCGFVIALAADVAASTNHDHLFGMRMIRKTPIDGEWSLVTYARSPILDLVQAFEDFVGYAVANRCAHLVISDYNLDDDSIDFVLRWLEENRAEILAEGEVTEAEIAVCAGFLTFLKSIPEEVRDLDDDDDE